MRSARRTSAAAKIHSCRTQPQTPLSNCAERFRGGLLDPIDRNAEILFGLFMLLTFTGSLSASTAAREELRIMLLAAIGSAAALRFLAAPKKGR